MAITLTYGGTPVVLPEDLHWENEAQWTPVRQARTFSIGGRQFLSRTKVAAGRPVHLVDYDGAWIERSDLEILQGWLALVTPASPMTLELHDARELTVVWDHPSGAIKATPALPGLANPSSSTQYDIELFFFTTTSTYL